MKRDIARMMVYSAIPMVVSLFLSWIIPSWLVPYLWFLSLVAAIGIAVIDWILEYQPRLAWELYNGHALTGWPVEQVRKLSDRQVPRQSVGPAGEISSDWPPELRVRDKRALDLLAARLKQRIFGHDDAIDAMAAELGTIVTRNRPRDNKPWLRFLCVGGEALGKQSLATLLGQGLCPNTFAFRAAITADGLDTGKLLSHVKSKPCSTLIIDGLEKADEETIRSIGEMMDGRPFTDEHGNYVSLRDCQVFLLSHRVVSAKDAELLQGGFTMTIDTIARICGLGNDFVFKTQGQFLFRFPQIPEQLKDLIDIVEAAFKKTARLMDFPIETARIPADVVKNEIDKVVKLGNYSQLAPRIENYLRRNREVLLRQTGTRGEMR